MAFPRVIHKGLGVYWGVSHCNSGHSMSQVAWVALVFGFTSLCIYLHYRSYTKTPPLHLLLAPRFHLLWGSGIVYWVILHSQLQCPLSRRNQEGSVRGSGVGPYVALGSNR